MLLRNSTSRNPTLVFGEQGQTASVRNRAIGLERHRGQPGDVGVAEQVVVFRRLFVLFELPGIGSGGRAGNDPGLAAGRMPARLQPIELCLRRRQQCQLHAAGQLPQRLQRTCSRHHQGAPASGGVPLVRPVGDDQLGQRLALQRAKQVRGLRLRHRATGSQVHVAVEPDFPEADPETFPLAQQIERAANVIDVDVRDDEQFEMPIVLR